MVLPIVHYDEPVLRRAGAPVVAFDGHLRSLAGDMLETMHAAEGIGLAAQQVGLELQFCVMDLRGVKTDFTWELDGRQPPLELFMPLAVANPRVVPLPGSPTEAVEEGCLSFPEIRGDVERPAAIRLTYQDLDGQPHTLVCDGLLARCVQHEVDHLHGVLFISRMSRDTLQRLDPALRRLKKQTRATRR